MPFSSTSWRVPRPFLSMWMSLTLSTMWICLRGASLIAFQTASMSLGTARAGAVIIGAPSRVPTSRAIRWQAAKSPGL